MEKISNSFEKKTTPLSERSLHPGTRLKTERTPPKLTRTPKRLLPKEKPVASMVTRNVPRRRISANKKTHFLKEQQIIPSIDFSIG